MTVHSTIAFLKLYSPFDRHTERLGTLANDFRSLCESEEEKSTVFYLMPHCSVIGFRTRTECVVRVSLNAGLSGQSAIFTYIHTSHTTHVVCVNFIFKWAT